MPQQNVSLSDGPANPYSPTASDSERSVEPARAPLSKRMRFTLFVHGVLLPGILLGMSLSGVQATTEVPWQSGRLEDYVALLLRPNAWFPFAPAILYAAVSLATWTIVPAMGQRAWVRLGIYIGVPLALHFFALLLLIYHLPMIILVALCVPGWHVVLGILNYFWRRQISIWHIVVLTTLCAVLCVLAQAFGQSVLYVPAGICLYLLVAAPGLNFMAYCVAARAVMHRHATASSRTQRIMISAWVAWLVSWLIGWRMAIITMLDEYAKLPTTNPNCYLSSAAAHAHPFLTGATVRGEITIAMCRFKFLEIVFKAAAPGMHRVIRRSYDCWCPPLAKLCQSNLCLANVTCIAMLPVELIAELLRATLRIEPAQLAAIYAAQTVAAKKMPDAPEK